MVSFPCKSAESKSPWRVSLSLGVWKLRLLVQLWCSTEISLKASASVRPVILWRDQWVGWLCQSSFLLSASRALAHLVIQVCLERGIYFTVHSNSFILCYANACTKYCFLLSLTNRPFSEDMGNLLSLQCDFMIQVCSSALASVAWCWAELQTQFLMQHGAAGHCVDMSCIPWMLSIIPLFSARTLAILNSQGLNLSFQKGRTQSVLLD